MVSIYCKSHGKRVNGRRCNHKKSTGLTAGGFIFNRCDLNGSDFNDRVYQPP
jgi:hypothetical protein